MQPREAQSGRPTRPPREQTRPDPPARAALRRPDHSESLRRPGPGLRPREQTTLRGQTPCPLGSPPDAPPAFGRALAQAALDRGDNVAATARHAATTPSAGRRASRDRTLRTQEVAGSSPAGSIWKSLQDGRHARGCPRCRTRASSLAAVLCSLAQTDRSDPEAPPLTAAVADVELASPFDRGVQPEAEKRHRAERVARVIATAAWPGVDSTQIRPPFASTKPFAIASPSPDPKCVSPAAGER
jgi:hypothetical protein